MKVVLSLALMASMAIIRDVRGFTLNSCKRSPTTFLAVGSYQDQLNTKEKYRGAVNGQQVVNGATSSTEDYVFLNVNPFMNKPPQPAPPAPPAPPTPTLQGQASATPQEVQSGAKVNPLDGNIVFLGLPLWILLSFNVFFGGSSPTTPLATPPTPPAAVVVPPAAPMTAAPAPMRASDASVAGVIVPSQPITKAEVRALFNLWNDALHTGDPGTVAKRYAKDGVLLPTLSDIPRNDFEAIKDYFVHFLEKKPDGKILEGEIYVGNNWAQDAGIYEFTFADGSAVKARYSFIYNYEDGKWMISHHHSSLMPEEVVRPKAITKDEVRGLFQLWNNALATGDPQKVADRYTKDAVLLPTLSDSARYTNDRIADYFVGFLKKKPVGKILEGNVKIGPNWAQDAGIYEFTFNDGSAVKGRYSFVYAYENGEWKISNHHSSILPEGAVSAMKKVAEMEKPAAPQA